MLIESLEPRRLLSVGTLSQQIIVDQFGWRADAPKKVVLFADPINGQNAAVSYTPAATFQVRRVSDDAVVFNGSTAAWNGGATDPISGDKVWSGDFSSLTTPGTYYIYDPTNDLRSYEFKLDNNLFDDILKTSTRMYYYQRTGTAIPAQYGGNWTHAIDHVGANQDTQAKQWLNGAPVAGSQVRDVWGGWFDAGDYNKYVVFTTSVLWNLLSAYEWNPGVFGDSNNIPESGNGVPDELDEVKWETDWLLKMQNPNGSVLNRVSNATYAAGNWDPSTDTQARYYTQATTWATASFAASLAHASREFAAFDSVYPGYSATLLAAAQNAWSYLQATPTMTPSSGSDGGSGLASADASANSGADLRLRVLASAELWKTTGTAAYKTYFEANYKNPATADNGLQPLTNAWPHLDPSLATDLNRAYLTYATTPGATASIVTEIKTALANFVDTQIVANYNSQADPYRSFMYSGHYTWGSNQLKAEWGNLLLYALKLNVNPANSAKYREVAEEYLHYFHGRNPLSYVYLSNMGTHGANLGGDKSPMEPYHSWFGDGSPLYDGASSTYGPVPGYLVGGPNQYFGVSWIAPPYGEPAMKAFKDWNSAWNNQHQANENSWEITEPAIYDQAAYELLLSQFATDTQQPRMFTASFVPGGASDTFKLQFNENVQASLTAGDLLLQNVETSATLSTSLSYDTTTNTATFTYAGLLPNGNYRATLAATDVRDAASNALTAGFGLSFIRVRPSGTLALSTGVRKIDQLIIGAGGQLDLGASSLAIDYAAGQSPLGTIAGLIQTGRNGGAWNAAGIITSMTAAMAPSIVTTLGVAEASDVVQFNSQPTALWKGQTVDATSVLVSYTFAGDANLDGIINGDDYFRIDAGYAAHAGGYLNGDFDYNGRLDADDYFLIDSNYNKAQVAMAAPLAASSVPPTAGAVFDTTYGGRGFFSSDQPSAYKRLMGDDPGIV